MDRKLVGSVNVDHRYSTSLEQLLLQGHTVVRLKLNSKLLPHRAFKDCEGLYQELNFCSR